VLKLLGKTSVLLICVAATAVAATKPDFSGTYSAQPKNDGKSTARSTVLHIVQTDFAVEVTRIYGNKSSTNRFPLDGSEGDYTTETGVRGKCQAHVKDESLVLESLVASVASSNRPSIRFQITEELQLSTDNNTLTIKTEIRSPDMSAEVVGAAFPNNPRTVKYQRSDKK